MLSLDLPKQDFNPEFVNIYEKLSKIGILGKLIPRNNFPDEPQFYQYMCERKVPLAHMRNGFGYGCSESEEKAHISAIAEALEHYCLLYERDEKFVRGSFNSIKVNRINPEEYRLFSKKQLIENKYKNFVFNNDTEFNWLKGYDVIYDSEVLVPAQLVYANYTRLARKEPIIRIPISTGAACGPSLEWCLYRGICEIIERDNYMISYLNNVKSPLLVNDETSWLFDFRRKIERYNLELNILYTSLDFNFHSIMAIIKDYSGIGPAISAGLGGSLNPITAVKTASFEAARRHISARDRFFRRKPLSLESTESLEGTLLRKQLLWSSPIMLQSLNDRLTGSKLDVCDLKNYEVGDDKKNLAYLVKQIKKKGYSLLYVDITTPEIDVLGLKVIKVLIPELFPLYHDERYPYKENERLCKVPVDLKLVNQSLNPDKINPSHPF